ncbi:MAG: ATP-binding protein [Myxococcota bacterium]|nr:ATP-binding protein [Myxococcota bacterium]
MMASDTIGEEAKTSVLNPLRRRAILIACFVATLVPCQYLILSGSSLPGARGYWYVALCFGLFPLLAALRSFRTASTLSGRERKAWLLFALACFFMFMAESFWVYLEISAVGETPMTALATTTYGFSPICFLVGMLFYQDRPEVAGASFVQAGNLGIVFSSVVFVYLLVVYQMLPEAEVESRVAMLKTFQGAIIMAATVTGLALVSLHFKGQKRAIMAIILFGMLCVIVEYFSFIYFFAPELTATANPYQALYLVASAAWFIAASEQQHLNPKTRDPEVTAALEKRAKQSETLLPAIAIAAVFMVGLFYGDDLRPEIVPFLVGSVMVLAGSLAVRNWWAQRVETRLNEQLRAQAEFLLKARDAAEASDVAKSRFLSWVSHETRTPLSGILGFTELLQDRHFGQLNDDQADFVKNIRESGDHLLDLINDLLDVTKITMGAVDLSLENVSPSEVVLEVVQNVELGGGEKEIAILNEVDPDAPGLRVDRRRLRQSLYNLLSNALKFTPAGGRVGLRWTIERNSWLCIEVWDEGIGIAEEDLERIFDEFYQVDRKRDEALGGSGIGLALTRRLARLHGGEVRVESEVGRGSSFFLVMPLAGPELEVVADPVAEEGNPEESGARAFEPTARILVVDDDPANLGVIRGLLQVRGIDPLVARSGQEAVALVSRERPQLVLMDIHMQGCDGFEALAQIRADESLAGIPVVAMTASASESDRTRYVEAGFDAFLPKPIDSKKLDRQLKRFA